MSRFRFIRAFAACAAACVPLAAIAADVDSTRWRSEFARFSAADEQRPPPGGAVVFVGSSSIRLWDDLETAFPRLPAVLKRGFGGSTMRDCADHVQQLVLAYRPRTVVIYAGENDLAEGAMPDEVLASVRRFVEDVRRQEPRAHLAFVSIKPSPLRAELLPAIRETNARIRAFFATLPESQYIDVHTKMLDADGLPRRDLFQDDRLHMNAAGYALWRQELNARLP